MQEHYVQIFCEHCQRKLADEQEQIAHVGLLLLLMMLWFCDSVGLDLVASPIFWIKPGAVVKRVSVLSTVSFF